MQLIRTSRQRENLAKFFWDMAKIELTLFLLGPLARAPQAETREVLAAASAGAALALTGFLLDGGR